MKGSPPTASLSSNSSFKMEEENEALDVGNNDNVSLKDIVLVLPSPSPNRDRYYSDDNFDDASSFCSSVSGSIDISGHSTDVHLSPTPSKKAGNQGDSLQPPPPPPPYAYETPPPPPLVPYTPLSSTCNTPCSSSSGPSSQSHRKPRRNRNRDLALSPSNESYRSVDTASSASESCRWGNCSSNRKDSFPTLSPGIHRKRPATLRNSFEENDKAPTCNRSTRGSRTTATTREERRKERQERRKNATQESLDKTARNAMSFLPPRTRDVEVQDLFKTPTCSNRASKKKIVLEKTPLKTTLSTSTSPPFSGTVASEYVDEALKLMRQRCDPVQTPRGEAPKTRRVDAIPTPPMRGRSLNDPDASREAKQKKESSQARPLSPYVIQIL